MPKNPESKTRDVWNEDNILNDVPYQEEDANLFQSLLSGMDKVADPEQNATIPGNILKGRIVEITKDFVVIDVGLKSEGLVPINEFIDPSEIALGNEVEVYLDQAEDEAGKIVLSKEKARRLRQ